VIHGLHTLLLAAALSDKAFVTGHDFSRAEETAEKCWALAPAGCSLKNSAKFYLFPATNSLIGSDLIEICSFMISFFKRNNASRKTAPDIQAPDMLPIVHR